MDNHFLIHHGIKGQKWGVRRFQNADGTRTEAGKKRDNERNVITKGTTFNRISTKIEETPHKDRTYLTFTSEDHDYYKEHMTNFRRMYNKNRKIFDMSYENIKDIIYPSHEKQVDEFVKLYKDKPVTLIKDIATESVYRDYNGMLSKDQITKSKLTSNYEKSFKTLNDEQLRTVGYQEFIRTYSEIPISTVYQSRLQKQGYNAIMDDNDILYNPMDSIRPKQSLIVFDPQENLKISKGEELTKRSYKRALKNNKRRRKRENKT